MARITQRHHIQYAHPEHKSMKEITVVVTKGEHHVLSKIQMYTKKFVSKGFIKALKIFIAQHEDIAEDLDATV